MLSNTVRARRRGRTTLVPGLSGLAGRRSGAPRPSKPAGRVLCYHGLDAARPGWADISPQQFERQLLAALDAGYRFVPAEELAHGAAGPPRRLAVTFDDGLRDVLRVAAPVLRELAVPWSLFVVTDWADGLRAADAERALDWNEIARLADAGAEIGSHSVSHADLGRIDAGRAREELERSRAVIRSRIGVDAPSFAAPLGASSRWRADLAAAAREAGYRTVYARGAAGSAMHGAVARTVVTRFDTERVFAAGLRGAFDSG